METFIVYSDGKMTMQLTDEEITYLWEHDDSIAWALYALDGNPQMDDENHIEMTERFEVCREEAIRTIKMLSAISQILNVRNRMTTT